MQYKGLRSLGRIEVFVGKNLFRGEQGSVAWRVLKDRMYLLGIAQERISPR